METLLKLQVRTVYGVDKIYPANDYARNFAQLLGQKTFTAGNIAKFKELGFTIEWIPYCGAVAA